MAGLFQQALWIHHEGMKSMELKCGPLLANQAQAWDTQKLGVPWPTARTTPQLGNSMKSSIFMLCR